MGRGERFSEVARTLRFALTLLACRLRLSEGGVDLCSLIIEGWTCDAALEAALGVRNHIESHVRSNAIRHTVDALASRGDEGRAKLR